MNKKNFNKTLLKNLVSVFVPVYFVILAILAYIALIEIANRKNNIHIIRENLLKENRTIIQNTIDQIYSDICFLSEMPEIVHFYDDESNNYVHIQNLFYSFIKNRKFYHQLRLIDTLGFEKIRLDLRQGDVIVNNKEQLQNKTDRYYFPALKSLNPEEFYISPFDLNVEFGAIELPFTPMLRFGKSITDSDNNNRIFLIINYLGDNMLHQIRTKQESASMPCYLLNQKGYYLIGPSPAMEWSFHFPDSINSNFTQYFPQEWQAIQGNKTSGHFNTSHGQFSFLKFNLCIYFLSRSGTSVNLIPKPCREWILLMHTDKSQIYQLIYAPILRKYLIFALSALIVILTLTWIYSTVRIQKNEALEQRRVHYQFLNTMIQTLQHPIFYVNWINHEFGCNEAFELLTGKSRAELKEMRIEKIFQKIKPRKKIRTIRNDAVKISEIRLKYPDGNIHNLLYYKASLLMQEKKIGLVGIFTDITDIRITETALRESEQKLRIANRTKDRFLSLIAHDLKNPFHAIMGLSHLIKTNYDSISDQDRKSIAGNIYNSAENTYQLLINLLDWARLQEGKIKVVPQTLDIRKLAEESIDLMNLKIQEKNLHITIDIDFDMRGIADLNMVKAIFRNLISNAIKFTDANGKIHIAGRKMLKHIEMSVADTGTGINSEDMKYLFKMDKKSAAPSYDVYQSTGLGLILSKEFIERNQGRIWAESEVGKGSIFYFTIPPAE